MPDSDSQSREYRDLIDKRIEDLRPRLLDLTARNPLISMSFAARSSSHIRIVDELPDVLLHAFTNEQSMDFRPLPSLDEDSKDELSQEFAEAYSSALRSDEAYNKAAEALSPEDSEFTDKIRRLERELKDRVRETLGMSPRVRRKEESLTQHAKNNGINPDFDLPLPDQRDADGRHDDEVIQTLLLPLDLERKLNSIISKGRTAEQETGLNVTRAAFGFLEWRDPARQDGRAFMSPLVLLPVSISARKSFDGPVFSISGIGDEPELNLALREKLSREFGVELPGYDGGSIEEYFELLGALKNPQLSWKVRRQIVIGVFPASRMAMYEDLDTARSDFSGVKVIEDLIAGTDKTYEGGIAEEYDVDHPEVAAEIKCLIKKADASQFSVLVDVARGKSIAVQGPPGTGKSDTIVNAIGAALSQGKKILFVAEKLAALEVVKSRLEEAELGEFILPLLAGRSSRDEFMNSIRERLEAQSRSPRALREATEKFQKIRDDLNYYVEVISSEWNDTGSTVHAVLGRATAASDILHDLPKALLVEAGVPPRDFRSEDIEELCLAVNTLNGIQRASAEKSVWSDLVNRSLSPIERDEVQYLAEISADQVSQLVLCWRRLGEAGLHEEAAAQVLDELSSVLNTACQILAPAAASNYLTLLTADHRVAIRTWLDGLAAHKSTVNELKSVLYEPFGGSTTSGLQHLAAVAEAHRIKRFQDRDFAADITHDEAALGELDDTVRKLARLFSEWPGLRRWQQKDVKRARDLIRKSDPKTLSLRTFALRRRGSVDRLEIQLTEADRISSAFKALQEVLPLSKPDEFGLVELSSLKTDIVGAGLLGFISGKVRASKKRYVNLFGRPKFNRDVAINDLDHAIKLLSDKEALLRVSSEDGLLHGGGQLYFSDRGSIKDLIEYCKEVSRIFGNSDSEDIEEFLLCADSRLLEELPIVNIEGHDEERLGNLDRVSSSWRKNLDERKRAVQDVDSLSALFVTPSRIILDGVAPLLEQIRKCIEQRTWLENHETCALLGPLYRGVATEPDDVQAVLGLGEDIQKLGAVGEGLVSNIRADRLPILYAALQELIESRDALRDTLRKLGVLLSVNIADLCERLPSPTLLEMMISAAGDHVGLGRSIKTWQLKNQIRSADLLNTAEMVMGKLPSRTDPGDIVSALIHRSVAARVYDKYGVALQKYSGETLEELRRQLKIADDNLRELSRMGLRSNLITKCEPPVGVGRGRVSDLTELSLLVHLKDKKRVNSSVRQIVRRSSRALMELKPIWMMSPLAVAQYIPRGSLTFDLCIIDEASQMPPEDALGALARSLQAMIVGDTKQLPPTSFFRQMLDDDADDEDEIIDESVLEMAYSAYQPPRMLRWHYRSKHSALIQFSNQVMYGGNLVVFPSPTEERRDMGVSLVAIEGLYKSGMNEIEAHAVVEATLRFMRESPERSLGVVAVNKKQADFIRERLDFEIVRNKAAADYVEKWRSENGGLEEFFVKNLENVQGDERDVIFISTVYGPAAPGGKVMQRFGPINGVGGQRRLNVLFTRAKEQIQTFSSMGSADIVATEDGNKGAWMLKRWLEYSAGGPLVVGASGGGDAFDSPFEEYVSRQIQALGCETVSQVGVVGYSIDIGIKHPSWPYGFILGVECDGATYHSSKSARDRDRHRQEVLERLGWHIHRVWSTDWFSDPRSEVEKIKRTVEARLVALQGARRHPSTPVPESVVKERTPAAPEVLMVDESPPRRAAEVSETVKAAGNSNRTVSIGSKVRVRYTDRIGGTLEFTLVRGVGDPDRGRVSAESPLGEATMDGEEGDTIEVVQGSRIRRAVIESIK